MTTRILLIVVLAMVCATPAWSTEKTKASDFVRFADNGSDIVVDLPGLDQALRSGADPNWINRENVKAESTLSTFVLLCGLSRESQATDDACTQAVKTLIAAGAKLQPEDREILFWPVSRGKTDLVTILLNLGADATRWPPSLGTRDSPVEYAAKAGHQVIVDLLVEHGATRPKERDAIQWRFVEASKFGSIAVLDELLKKGAAVNEKARNGETALINGLGLSLLIPGCQAYAKILYLLAAGADPNRSGLGESDITYPLHQAIWSGSFLYNKDKNDECGKAILTKLITEAAFVSSLDSNGQTPLHIAAARNYLVAAQLLLKSGAKVMPRNNAGKTPLDLAESGEMIKLLKSHGATER